MNRCRPLGRASPRRSERPRSVRRFYEEKILRRSTFSDLIAMSPFHIQHSPSILADSWHIADIFSLAGDGEPRPGGGVRPALGAVTAAGGGTGGSEGDRVPGVGGGGGTPLPTALPPFLCVLPPFLALHCLSLLCCRIPIALPSTLRVSLYSTTTRQWRGRAHRRA